MANIVQMKDKDGNKEYPITSSAAVGMSDGSGSLNAKLQSLEGQMAVSEEVSAQALLEQANDVEGLKDILTRLLNGSLVMSKTTTNEVSISGATLKIQGSDVPSVSPDFVGQEFIDTTNKIAYIAVGNESVEDWKPINIA